MKITVASIAARGRSPHFDELAAEYLQRLQAYADTDAQVFKNPTTLFEWIARLKGRTPPQVVLLDERGRLFSSAQLAEWLRGQQDAGRQRLVFAVGPADGWSRQDRAGADLLLSLGPLTLPHELAKVVISEQLYRAFTILAGHPYHRG